MKLLITTEALNHYAPGDIVAVVPDSHVWGREETLDAWTTAGGDPASFPNPGFTVIEIPEEPVDLNLAVAEMEALTSPTGTALSPRRKAGWRVDLDRLTALQKSAAEQPGAVVRVDRSRRLAIRRKSDDAQLPPRIEVDGELVGRAPATAPIEHPPGMIIDGRLPGTEGR